MSIARTAVIEPAAAHSSCVRRCRSWAPWPAPISRSGRSKRHASASAQSRRSAPVVVAARPQAGSGLTRKLRAILIADVVESVRLMEQNEDDTIRRWRDFLDVVIDTELPRHRGRLVKSLGDGMLIEFESVGESVQSAIDMLAQLERANAGLPLERQIRLRIGIHLADVVIDDIDVFGDGVNLAARLAALGGPQEIIVSAAVREQLNENPAVDFEYLGERKLKNLQRLVRVFRISRTCADSRREDANHQGMQYATRVPSCGPSAEMCPVATAREDGPGACEYSDLSVIARLSVAMLCD